MENPPNNRASAISKIWRSFLLIAVSPLSEDEDARRQEYILNIILVASIAMLAVLTAFVFYHATIQRSPYAGVSTLEFSLLPLFFLFLHALSRRGRFVAASYLLVGILFASNTYAIYSWGADLPVSLLAYAFIICIAGILISTAFGVAMTVMTACSIGITWHLHMNGVILPQPQHPTEDDAIIFIVFYFLIMAVTWLSNREIERSLLRARKSERALTAERNLLEVRVVQRTEELRRTELEKIEQMRRFAEFGELASGLFHDLLNLLNAISLRTEGNPEEEASLAAASATTRHISRFMHAVQRQLAEKDSPEIFSIAEAIAQAIQLVEHKAMKENIRIVFEQENPRDPLSYAGMPFKLHQILINLLTNAIDAYDGIPNDPSRGRTVCVRTARDESAIIVSVSDKGCGIPDDSRQNIFKPFFSTKEKQRGAGIGLPTVKKIVEHDFHGTITVASLEGEGSTFTVRIPISNESSLEPNDCNHSAEGD